MADLEAVRAKWRQVLQSSNDEEVQARAHEVLMHLASPEAQAKYQATMDKVDDLRSQPDPSSFGEVASAVGKNFADRASAIGRGVKAVATHPIDTFAVPEKRREFERGVDDAVTLGYGRRMADSLSKTFGSSDPTFAETEAADKAAAPDVRAGGGALGMFLPSPVSKTFAGASKVAGRVLPASETVLGEAARGAGRAVASYEATAPAMTALAPGMGSASDRLKAAGRAAVDPTGVTLAAGIGGGVAGAKELLGGAPARAEASELGALTEGVQYKTKMQKYRPNEKEIGAALAEVPEIRSLIKTDPVKAQSAVEAKLSEVADTELQPYYDRMKAIGRDGVPLETIKNQLEALRGDWKGVAKKPLAANLDGLIAEYEQAAAGNGGRIPADMLRSDATTFQQLGFGNLNMFGPVPLVKQLKQQVGSALREAIADHVESLPDSTPAGKAMREAFKSANKRTATWLRIQDIVEEKAARIDTKSPPMGDLVNAGLDIAKHPLKAAGKAVLGALGPAGDVLDRRFLGPAMRSGAAQAVAPAASAAADLPLRLALPFGISGDYAESLARLRQKQAEQENGRQ